MSNSPSGSLVIAADIVAAFVSGNSLPKADLPALIESVHAALAKVAAGLAIGAPETAALSPAVPVRKSITDEYIVCLEDGKKLKSMKRHLGGLGLTPDAYRAKWGLPADYPMVAPAYAARRSEMAKKIGLGRKPKAASA